MSKPHHADFTSVYDTLILGAGPAGLMAACMAQQGRVAVLEKNPKPGRKLLISGSGRCNITRAGEISAFCEHYPHAARFVKPCLMSFTNRDLTRFFAKEGLRTTELNDGKIFPVTQRSEDVLRVLLDVCRKRDADIFYEQPAACVTFRENDACFHVETQNRTWRAKKLILATGGKSYPSTGSTGDGYRLAEMLGHSLTQPRPALTPIYVNPYCFTSCAGISLENRSLSVWRNGKKIASSRGDILFTHHGLSGPGILDFSRHVLPDDTLKIAFTDTPSREALDKILQNELAENSKKIVKNLLASRFSIPERLADCLVTLAEIPPETCAWEINRQCRANLTKVLDGFPLHVHRLGDFGQAMCTAGGIPLAEVNRLSMESRICPRLFFCGEILDVDGDTGGYNLQFAFSSGTLASRPNNS